MFDLNWLPLKTSTHLCCCCFMIINVHPNPPMAFKGLALFAKWAEMVVFTFQLNFMVYVFLLQFVGPDCDSTPTWYSVTISISHVFLAINR